MTTYFGFAIADSMFPAEATVITRRRLAVEDVQALDAQGILVPCLNPSHAATIEAMRSRFGIGIQIPERAPQVVLQEGDSLVVMGVRGLPRLTAERHEYTEEEIAGATFAFSMYTVEQAR